MKKLYDNLYYYLASCLVLLLGSFSLLADSTSALEIKDEYQVAWVIDGDTIVLKKQLEKIKVRLIGIDAPEIHENEKANRDSQRSGLDLKTIVNLGNKAQQHLRQLLSPGTKVTLDYDINKFDKYGRILAYVYSEKGQLINLKMIEDGFAYSFPIAPDLKYEKEFREAAQKAKLSKIGLWSTQ